MTWAYTVELGTIGVVVLLATKKEVAGFDIPALEMIRFVDADFRFHISPIRHPSTFETKSLHVTSQLSRSDEVVVGVLDVIGVDVLLAADVGGIAAAEAGGTIDTRLIRGLGGIVHDGTANVWDTKKENVDPVRLLTTNRWVVSLFVDGSMNNIWTGDQRGKLTRTIINVPRMASLVKASLKRNMTREEWNQYVGKNIPYVKFK